MSEQEAPAAAPAVNTGPMTDTETRAARRAARRHGFIGFVFDYQERVRYDLIEVLCRTRYGTLYSANSAGLAVPQWRLKRYAISQWSASPRTTERTAAESVCAESDFALETVNNEFAIGATIRRRLDDNFCLTSVLCASHRFFEPDRSFGTLVFPYVQTVTLESWLRYVQHRSMISWRSALVRGGFRSLEDLLQRIGELEEIRRKTAEERDFLRRYSELYDTLLERLSRIQMKSLSIGYQLLNTFEELHEVAIYHRNVTPANILIEQNGETLRVRVANFGFGCAESIDGDGVFDQQFPFLSCPTTYTPALMYRDPWIYNRRYPDDDLETRREYTSAFEIYSLGKILQHLFDPESLADNGDDEWIVVQETEFMPYGVIDLIADMTGEEQYVPPNRYYPYELSDDERAERAERFAERPEIEVVVDRFERIRRDWNNADPATARSSTS